jgi:hypothetical protein
MVVSPIGHIRLGLDASPADAETGMSATDARILAEAKARSPRVALCVFRGVHGDGDEVGSWAFDPALDETQCRELATRLLRGQIEVYRGMLYAGLSMFVHTEWGMREVDAFRWAVDRRIEELVELNGGAGTLGGSQAAIDLWLLRNLTFFFTLSFDKFVETVLPDKLAMMEKRMERIRRMLGLRGA